MEIEDIKKDAIARGRGFAIKGDGCWYGHLSLTPSQRPGSWYVAEIGHQRAATIHTVESLDMVFTKTLERRERRLKLRKFPKHKPGLHVIE